MKKLAALAAVALLVGGLTACENDSDVVSENLSTDADNYKIFRSIIVYNTFTDKYIQEVTGYCSLGNADSGDRVSYTCKVGDGQYVKDIITKSDNSIILTHQLESASVSPDFYQVTFKPTTVIPDPEWNVGN